MAAVGTSPGVYLEEVESPVRPIVGVKTSIAAFVGPSLTGPRTPVTVTTWSDFERAFGGLWTGSEMSYSVYQFFLNGGSEAVAIRIGDDPEYASLELIAGELTIQAQQPGSGGNFTAMVTGADDSSYTLTVTVGDVTEEFAVSIDPAARSRWLDRALATSQLVELVEPADLETRPANTEDGGGASSKAADHPLDPQDVLGDAAGRTGLFALQDVNLFNLLIIPDQRTAPQDGADNRDDTWAPVLDQAALICEDRRAMLLLDPPHAWTDLATAVTGANAGLPVAGLAGRNAAIFFPRVTISDPAGGGDLTVGAAGTVAGVFAATDARIGVWKAPAGTDATLSGVRSLVTPLTDAENGQLNPLGVNCLRSLPIYGRVVWGSRTCRGSDQAADPWKYIPVRRTALFIEETLFRATKWVVFQPNDEPLWSSIRLNIGAFMDGLFRQGAFQGRTSREAYFVKCDAENNPQSEIDLGIVNIDVGFQPLKPAEFVRIRIQQTRPDPL